MFGRIGGHHLGADLAVLHDVADFDDMFAKGPLFLGDQGRIRGDAVDHAKGHPLPDLFEVCSIEKKFHVCCLH